MMNPTNIASHLPTMAQQQPDTAAVIVPQRHGKYISYSYKQLNEESDILARGLQQQGITKGTRTVLMVTPGLEFFALVFALFKIGAVMVAVDPGMGIRNLGKCLQEAQPTAFIGILKAHIARILLGWARKSNRLNILASSAYGIGMPNLKTLRAAGLQNRQLALPETSANDMAAILFTSGSTGVPKGVVYTHANFTAQVAALKDEFNIQPGEIDLGTFPLFALFAPALGMTSVIPRMDFTRPGHVDPRVIIDAINDFSVTTMFGSPALLNRVGRWGVDNNIKLPSLKRVLSAGAPVSATVLERYLQLLPADAQIFTPYGATESLPVSSISSDEILAETSKLTAQGKGVCVGRPVASIQVSIIKISDEPVSNWHDDLLLANNEIGEIVVQGPQVTEQYFNRPRSTELAKIHAKDGKLYHRMGDVGYLDDNGRLWFCGRLSQRVIIHSGTLFTIPCEAVFNVHKKVFRTALVGIKKHNTCKPALCVELEHEYQGADRDKLRRALLEIATSYDHTSMIKDILFHQAFPVDIRHNAKIDRHKLALWASKQLQ